MACRLSSNCCPQRFTRVPELPVAADCCLVEDKPQYDYRGFMLDVCRTWMDKDNVKHYIDLLAFHKINKLHLHLSDDEAWRLEIVSHPELAEVGGYRGGGSPYGRATASGTSATAVIIRRTTCAS